jgi:hypothetical protein
LWQADRQRCRRVGRCTALTTSKWRHPEARRRIS